LTTLSKPGLNASKLIVGSEWKRCSANWRHTVEIVEIRGTQIFFKAQWNGKQGDLPADLFLRDYRPTS
jgi:hypothetical protein